MEINGNKYTCKVTFSNAIYLNFLRKRNETTTDTRNWL